MQKILFKLLVISILFSISFQNFAQKLSKKESQFWQAMKANNLELAEKYLRKNVNPDAQNLKGHTPIFWALASQKFKLAQLLVDYEADINAPIYGNSMIPEKATMLMLACNGNTPTNLKITEFLLKNKAEVNTVISAENLSHDFSALHIAILNRNPYAVKLLLENGAKVGQKIKDNPQYENFTPLALALNQGVDSKADEDLIETLLRHGAKIRQDLTFRDGITVPYEVLFFSIKHKAPYESLKRVAQNLQKNGADFKQVFELPNYKGELLPFVAKYNEEKIVHTLLCCLPSKGLNAQVIHSSNRDEIGYTALHFAIQRKRKPMAKHLLNHVDTTLKAQNGKTAMDLGRESGFYNKLFFLESITQEDIPQFDADSLLKILARSKGKKRINSLTELGKNYITYFQLQEAEKNLQEALRLAKQLGYKNGIASAFNLLGNLYLQKTYFRSYITSEDELLSKLQEMNVQPSTINKISDPFQSWSDYNILILNQISKKKYQDVSIKFEEGVKLKIKRKIFDTLSWTKANHYFANAQQIRLQQKGEPKLWGIHQTIKNLEQESKYLNAEKLYLEWVKIREVGEDSIKLIWALRDFGRFYKRQHQYKKADECFQKIITYYQKIDVSKAVDFCINLANDTGYSNDSIIRAKRKTWQYNYYEQALELSKSIKDSVLKNNIYRQIADDLQSEIWYWLPKKEDHRHIEIYLKTRKLQNEPIELIKSLVMVIHRMPNNTKKQHYFRELGVLLKKSGYNKKRFWLDYAYFYQHHFQEYTKAFELKINLYDKKHLTLIEAKNPIDWLIFKKGDENQAQRCLRILDKFLESHSHTEEKIWAFRLKSHLFQYLENYAEAAENREKILSFENKNPQENSKDFADTGFLFQLAKNQEKSLNYFRKSLEINQKYLELEPQIPIHILKIAYCYESFNDIRSAEKQYVRAFKTAKENLGKSKGVLERYVLNLHTAHEVSLRISQFYAEKKNQKKRALQYAETSLKVAKTLPNGQVFGKVLKVRKSAEWIEKLKKQ